MHLLVETAIIDSAEYEVLSFEEVEDMKKEYTFLAGRIDAAKRKLALESKVRDAALSLSRLYNGKKGKRRSLLGSSEVTQKTDEELIQSNQKVEQLVQELWGLNNRVVEIQRRLLQHSAGILGMTHQGSIRIQGTSGQTASSRFSTQGQLPIGGDDFGDGSLYRTSDNLDGIVTTGPSYHNRYRQNPTSRVSIHADANGNPVPSPDLQQLELRLEKLNVELRKFLLTSTDLREIPEVPKPTGHASGRDKQLTMLEQGVKFLQQSPAPAAGIQTSEELEQSITILWDMLVLGNEESRTRRASQGPGRESLAHSTDDEDSDAYGTAFSIEAFSYKVQSLYTKATKLRADRSSLRMQLEQQQQMYLEQKESFQELMQSKEEDHGREIFNLEQEIDQLNETIQSRDQDLNASNQELDMLTDEIKSIQEELRDREDERDQAKIDMQALQLEISSLQQNALENSRAEIQNHDTDAMAIQEEVNMRLVVESRLKEKEAVEIALLEKLREKEEVENNLLEKLQEKEEVENNLLEKLREKEEVENNLLEKLREKELEFVSRVEAEEALQAKIKEKETILALRDEAHAEWQRSSQAKMDELTDLEKNFEALQEVCNLGKAELDAAKAELEGITTISEERFRVLERDLQSLNQAKAALEADNALTKEQKEALGQELSKKDRQIDEMGTEMRELIERIAQLSTEAVLAKAELDHAYGSRSQRAAETAAAVRAAAAQEATQSQTIDPAFLQAFDEVAAQNQSLLQEISALKATRSSIQNLEKRNQLLQIELDGMLQDFEGLTKQSIEFENERTQLEGTIDQLREKIEALEIALGEERVRMLGSRSLSSGSNPDFTSPRNGGESVSTQLLKTEFKKMVRDMKSEQMKALRVSLNILLGILLYFIRR